MPIHTRKNLYHGVNAHLHSYFQEDSGWESFHAVHIVHLLEAVQELLPIGYRAFAEKSLQLSVFDPDTGESDKVHIKPDVSVWRERLSPVFSDPYDLGLSSPLEVLTLDETLVEPEYLRAVVIMHGDGLGRYKSVTRIELLSPANKPPGSHASQYVVSRAETLLSGIHMVEIDYLHERRFPVERVASYPDRRPGSLPYNFLVSFGEHEDRAGQAFRYGCSVDESIPSLPIPLVSGVVNLGLNGVYQRTYASNPAYGEDIVDYSQEPPRIGTYAEEDQSRIRECMARAASS
jgi:hypothetical protein